MITLLDFYMGRDIKYRLELTPEIEQNAIVTIMRVNMLLSLFYATFPHIEHRVVNSGWRPVSVNQATPGAAIRSKHITGEACDLGDIDGALDTWIMENPEVLEECGLWHEHPAATKGWCHLQTSPYRSWTAGKSRTFYP